MSTCSACAEYTIKSCTSSIVLKAGLTPSTNYYWKITTPRGKVYQRQASTDNQGSLTIDTTVLPAGTLNPHAGAFQLEIRDGANYLNTVPMTLDGDAYDCVFIWFKDIDDTHAFNVIQ